MKSTALLPAKFMAQGQRCRRHLLVGLTLVELNNKQTNESGWQNLFLLFIYRLLWEKTFFFLLIGCAVHLTFKHEAIDFRMLISTP